MSGVLWFNVLFVCFFASSCPADGTFSDFVIFYFYHIESLVLCLLIKKQ